MVRYIIRRLLWVIVLLFLVSLITFFIFYTLPSADPASCERDGSRTPNSSSRSATTSGWTNRGTSSTTTT